MSVDDAQDTISVPLESVAQLPLAIHISLPDKVVGPEKFMVPTDLSPVAMVRSLLAAVTVTVPEEQRNPVESVASAM